MQIDIEIPRPFTTLLFFAAVVGGVLWWNSGGANPNGVGGDARAEVESSMRDVRREQSVLARREEILRTQLASLDALLQENDDPEALAELRKTREDLLLLLKDKADAEEQIRQFLRELRDSEEALAASTVESSTSIGEPTFQWPVEPLLGISAKFHDSAYFARFGLQHEAIDIPTEQGTNVWAVADGIVTKVSDRGMGFNALIIQHGGGYATLYGHVSQFLVSEGQRVRAGQIVAKSGGTPGTPGAGRMTTGPHLHLEVMRLGEHIDPLSVLPE